MDKFAEMGKTELRAACKEAGISYGKLNNDGMRDALRAAQPKPVVTLSAEDKQQIANEARDRSSDNRHTGTGIKIEKDREERNGIKRPSIGGKCRAIWDALDAYRDEVGELPTARVTRDLAADEGWDPTTTSIQFYQWRKFNGITGRSK